MILLLEKLNPFFDRPLIPLRTFLMNVVVAVCVIGFIRSGSLVASGAEPVGRPNVIVILTDDQGWGDLSLHGNPNLSTPNIDSLARDGAQVDHFYVCAVCSPTRAEF